MNLSKSKIDCLMSCPIKFKYEYIDKIESNAAKPAFLEEGEQLHKVFEETYSEMKDKEITRENIIEVVKELAIKHKVTHRKTDLANWLSFNFKLAANNEFFPIHTELKFFDKKLLMNGVVDSIRIMNGKKYLIDYKTGASGDISGHRFQLSIYHEMYKNNCPDESPIEEWAIWYSQDNAFYSEPVKGVSINAMWKKIWKARKMVKDEVWNIVKVDRGNLFCCKWCPHFDLCFKEMVGDKE